MRSERMTELAETLLIAGNVLAALSILLTSVSRILRDRNYEQPLAADGRRQGGAYFD